MVTQSRRCSKSLLVVIVYHVDRAFPFCFSPVLKERNPAPPQLIWTLLQLGYAERECAMRGRAPHCTVLQCAAIVLLHIIDKIHAGENSQCQQLRAPRSVPLVAKLYIPSCTPPIFIVVSLLLC